MSQEQILDAQYVDIDSINTDTWNPRNKPKNEKQKQKEEDKYQVLKTSIKNDGILVPIMVFENGKGYGIVSGRHRLRAAKELGLKQVPISIDNNLKNAEESEKTRITGSEFWIGLDKDESGKPRWVESVYKKAGYTLEQAISGTKAIDNWFSHHTDNKTDWNQVHKLLMHLDDKHRGTPTNPIFEDSKFMEVCESIPYSPKTQYQLLSIVSKLKGAILDKAEKQGLKTDKQILLTTGPLPEHPRIQEKLIDKVKDVSYDIAKEAIHQTVKDLRSGYLRRSKPDSDFYILGNARPKDDESILPPISIRILEINAAISKYLFQMTDKAITKGVAEYDKTVVESTRNFRLEVLKTLDERNMINFYNNLKLVKLVTDDAIKMVKEELETIDKKKGMTGK